MLMQNQNSEFIFKRFVIRKTLYIPVIGGESKNGKIVSKSST